MNSNRYLIEIELNIQKKIVAATNYLGYSREP
jgi:hypothetical protein